MPIQKNNQAYQPIKMLLPIKKNEINRVSELQVMNQGQ